MRLEDCLVELVCHARWLANKCLSDVEPELQRQYGDDLAEAQSVLQSLSKTFSHIELLSEMPSSCVKALCAGRLYLLAACSILGECPPTLHRYLTQRPAGFEEAAQQTQLLVVRWLVQVDAISVDDLLEVVFGPGTRVADYANNYEAHSALAKAISETDPFFLGAHILILRGLLLRHCCTLLSIEEIVGHVALLNPDDTTELDPHTLEDALLAWVRAVIHVVDPESGSLSLELAHVDDLYLHTNDGRALALVIHRYRPDLLPFAAIHFLHPLTVWQRQDNWSSIIRSAENLGLWVGVFADEMVAHGFNTLQLHVMRIVLELFAVLAFQTEQSYESLCHELEAQTTFVDAHNVSAVTRSLQAASNFEPLSPPPAERDDSDESFPPRATAVSPSISDATPPPLGSSPPPSRTAAVGAGKTDAEAEEASDEEETDRIGEVNAVLMGVFLQGVKMPIHQALPSAPEPVGAKPTIATGNDTGDTTFEIHRQNDESATGRFDHTNDDDDDVNMLSPDPGTSQRRPPMNVSEMQPLDVQQSEHNTATDLSVDPAVRLFQSNVSEEVPRSVSPTIAAQPTSVERRQRRVANAVASSVAHFRAMHPNNNNNKGKHGARGNTPGRMDFSVVQGSIDSDGIEGLLQELTTMAEPSPLPGRAAESGEATLREQNQRLRWALEEQQTRIGELVGKLRKQVRKQEFAAILKHLRTTGRKKEASPLESASPPNVPVAVALDTAVPIQSTFNKKEAVPPTRAADDSAPLPPSLLGATSFATIKKRTPPPSFMSPSQIETMRSDLDGTSASADAPSLEGKDPSPSTTEASKVDPSPPLAAALGGCVPSAVPRSATQPNLRDVSAAAVAAALPRAAVAKPIVGKETKGGTAFDVSLGRGAIATPPPAESALSVAAGPPLPKLNIPQLQKLKERHEMRKDVKRQAVAKEGAPVAAGPADNKGRRNNKNVIANALRYACLPGQVNKPQLEGALAVLEQETASHFVVLLKDEYNHVFKAVYATRPDGAVQRIFGTGPHTMTLSNFESGTTAVPKMLRFDTGLKCFVAMPAKDFDQNADAIAFVSGKIPK